MRNDESFFKKVYDVVKCIPPGRVTTYGAIARFIGSSQSSRMVGWALNSTKCSIENIPAHRVVNRNGELTGKIHFRTPKLMEELLLSEGIPVKEDKIENFKNFFWDPYKDLD